MNKKLTALVLCAALMLALPACSAAVAETTPTAAPAVTAEATAEPTAETASSPEAAAEPASSAIAPAVSVQTESETMYSDDGTTALLEYSNAQPGVVWPGHEDIASAVNALLTEDAALFADGTAQTEGDLSGKESYLASAEEYYAADSASFATYALQRTVQVTRADSAVLSLTYIDYTYAGGAHGYTGLSGHSYDMRTGKELTLEDLLASDTDCDTFLAAASEQVRDLSKSGEYYGVGFFDGYEDSISGLFRADNWYFNDEGLVVIANPYELASYADGSLQFTLSYSWLRYNGVAEEYLPADSAADGKLSGEIRSSADGAVYCWDDGTDGTGSCVTFTASGTVENVHIRTLTYLEYSNKFIEGDTCFYAGSLSDGESLCVQTWIPDTMPSLSVSWRDADGEHTNYIAQSGMDGSLVLMRSDEFSVLPVNLSGKSSFCYDVNGDGIAEEIRTTAEGTDDLNTYTISVDGKTLSRDNMADGDRYDLWLCDLNSDGVCEIFFSSDWYTDDFRTCGWYGDTLEPIAFTGISRFGSDPNAVSYSVDGRIEFSSLTPVLGAYYYQLGTYGAFIPLELSADGYMQPAVSFWTYSANDYRLTVKKALPVTIDGVGASEIAAGEKILLTGTDGFQTAFRTEDGRTGTFSVSYSAADSAWTINGELEDTYFDFLPYAG